MQRDIVVKGKGLGGSADLTLLAPIKPGLIESLESVTYKTRIKRVLEALHGARQAGHEYQSVRLLSDAVERVGVIQSVRVAVLEPEDKVLLAVTFDGSWQAYIRVLWDKVGALLDLIFCGTVDYVTAADHPFPMWHEWARRVQVETGFFYGPSEASASDVQYYRRVEAMRARGVQPQGSPPDGPYIAIDEGFEVGAWSPGAEEAMQRLIRLAAPGRDDPTYPMTDPVRMVAERMRNGMTSLSGLYRLADLHRPGTPDGEVLRRAGLNLLQEFVQARDTGLLRHLLDQEQYELDKDGNQRDGRFARQIAWLFPDPDKPALQPRPLPPPPPNEPIAASIRARIQGGIVRPYEGITHGAVLLLHLPTPHAATELLAYARRHVDSDAEAAYAEPLHVNLAFTQQGLRAAGLTDDELDGFPDAFREGMAARCGLLGDVRGNHPRRWRLPRAFVDVGKADNPDVGIELEGVHAVLQLRRARQGMTKHETQTVDIAEPHHPLRHDVEALRKAMPEVRILAIQSMRRRGEARIGADGVERDAPVEHFGYADGHGQPDVEPPSRPFDRNRVHLGEIVLGHANASDPPIDVRDPQIAPVYRDAQRWLADGSFLVLRKYRQFVHRLEAAVDATAVTMLEILRDKGAGSTAGKDDKLTLEVCREIVYGKLMGRLRNGASMVEPDETEPTSQNLFDYADDKSGKRCPLSAHVRRAHPRTPPAGAGRVPRLMRRGMTYGPDRAPGKVDDGADRGLIFMAYNADLSEQFEVVQRWLTGGNPTGTSSASFCPIVGVPPGGQTHTFRFEHEGHAFRVRLPGGDSLFDEASTVVQLEWGLYLFAPSLDVIARLGDRMNSAARSITPAGSPYAPKAAPVPWDVAHGRRQLAALERVESEQGPAAAAQAWKAALEDPQAIDRLDSAALWAAIRADHGGLLRTPYGVLVTTRDLIHEVFRDVHGRYSVSGQFDRMRRSFGEISLGLDKGAEYDEQSEPINTEIGKLREDEVYELAFEAAKEKIDSIVKRARLQGSLSGAPRFEAPFEAREIADEVLAKLSEAWFGISDKGGFFKRGGTDWNWQPGQPPLYPGHFTALSRYMFQPNPGPMPVELGQRYGQALRVAMRNFVAHWRHNGGFDNAPLAKAILDHPKFGTDDDFVARNMVGVLMGFNPTIIGAVLNVLREWQRDGTFGLLRGRLIGNTAFDKADAVMSKEIVAATRMRPMPQLGWRTVLWPHRLGADGAGGVDLRRDDLLVLGIASGTQQALAAGDDDHLIMFGGRRTPGNHPTHACPGYRAGIGAMKGALAAILSRPEDLRPNILPLTFVLGGPVAATAPVVAAAAAPVRDANKAKAAVVVHSKPDAKSLQNATGRLLAKLDRNAGRVLGWGDSWLDYRAPGTAIDRGADLRDWLERGFDVSGVKKKFAAPRDFCVWTDWPRMVTLAKNPEPFCSYLKNEILLRPVSAILLSGGGNDSTYDTLKALIRDKKAGAASAMDQDKLKEHIRALGDYYVRVLGEIERVFAERRVDPVPVIVHGYDYPLPRGKKGFARWLLEPFQKRGWSPDTDAQDRALADQGMRDLIDEFNETLAALGGPKGKFAFVHHVRLAGTLEQAAKDQPQKFASVEDLWNDDLHPTNEGFELLARKIFDAVNGLKAPAA